uniref:Major sperm protein n=1 Tax=Panagrolaimus sp. JU765 TaxID=591449 RepID=A0AC34QE44_9BILA
MVSTVSNSSRRGGLLQLGMRTVAKMRWFPAPNLAVLLTNQKSKLIFRNSTKYGSKFTYMSTHALACVPPCCPISAAGGVSKHKLVNQCAARLAFKIRSTDNSHYGVNPVFGFVEIGEEVELTITRKAGKPKADRLVVMFKDVPKDATDPKPFFDPSSPKTELTGEITLKLSAAE